MNASQTDPVSVTAGEISRNFGQWQDRALHVPVVVTNHGRPRVVVISAELYAAFTQDGLPAEPGDQANCEIGRSAILDHTSEGFVAWDRDLRVTAANGVFEALIGLNAERLEGKAWDELFPSASQAIIGEQLRRVLRAGDTVEFEASTASGGVRRCMIRAFPYPGGVATLVINRTEERDLRRRLEEAMAFQAALSSLHGVATARLNVRGLIVDLDLHFSQVSGFKACELLDCRLTDIVRPSERGALGQAIEQVLRGGPPSVSSTTLLIKGGDERVVELGVAAIVRDGVVEGLVAAIHPSTELQAGARPATARAITPGRP